MKTRALFLSLLGLLLPVASLGQTAAAGYAVTDFATGFPNGFGGIGPIGLAFDASGNLFVGDYFTGFLYKFGPAGGIATATTQVNSTSIAVGIAGLAFGKDGSLFLARQGNGDVVQLDAKTGTVIRMVATVSLATGLATDPLSGDLFVSNTSQIFRISNFSSGPGTVTVYASEPADGLAFGPDGTLYAALLGFGVAKIAGTNSPTPGAVTVLPVSVPSIDGMAISANPSTPFLYGNRNDGIITKVDLTTSSPTLTNIVTGGTRGDFAAVGPDGCLYATQTDRVLKVTNADGTCLPPPLGPLFPTTPPMCSASTSNSSNFNGTPIPSGDYIWFNANFTANGIPSAGATITLSNSIISFTANGVKYSLSVPNAQITFSTSATCATTSFSSNLWTTTVPISGSDEIFLSGLAFPVPPGGLPGGINPVTWTGTLTSTTADITVNWKWGAAVYTSFTTAYNDLKVKPTHSNSCLYNNSDHAGTPEAFESFVSGGARGGGGSNFTGSWSGTLSVTPVCH